MDPPLVMEYATSLKRYCDDNLPLGLFAAASVVFTALDRLKNRWNIR